MATRRSAREEVNLLAKIADLQEIGYQNMLLVHAMMELFIEKGLLTKDELVARADTIDAQLNRQIEPFAPFASMQTEGPRREQHPAARPTPHASIQSPFS